MRLEIEETSQALILGENILDRAANAKNWRGVWRIQTTNRRPE